MLIKCINEKCSHEWDYKGKSTSYICCPKCSYRFKLQRGIEKHSKTMLTYKRNIPDNIVNIVPKIPLKPKKNEYRKVIEKPKTEFIQEIQDYEPVIKLCEKHKRSARYDSTEKKWICKQCINEEIDEAVKKSGINVIPLTDYLGSVREIKESIVISQIPFENKVRVI